MPNLVHRSLIGMNLMRNVMRQPRDSWGQPVHREPEHRNVWRVMSCLVIVLSLTGGPSYAATYCDFNIRADCPPPIADAEFPADEMKAACLKDIDTTALANESDELKDMLLGGCVNYARSRFAIAHWRNVE
jgi:hypothetical protein